MKKRAVVALMVVALISLSACGKDKENTKPAEDKKTVTETSEPAKAVEEETAPMLAEDTTTVAAEPAPTKEKSFDDEVGTTLADDIGILGFPSEGDASDHLWLRCSDGRYRLIDADRTVLKVIDGKPLEDHNDGYMFYSDDIAEYANGLYDLEGNEITSDYISDDEKAIDILHYKGKNYLVTLQEKETISDYSTVFTVYDNSLQPIITVDSESITQGIDYSNHWYNGISMDEEDQRNIELIENEEFKLPKKDRYEIEQLEGSELFLIYMNIQYALLIDLERNQCLLLDAPMFSPVRVVGDEVLWHDGYRFRYNLSTGQYNYVDDELSHQLANKREVEQGKYFNETVIQDNNQFVVVKNENDTCFTAYCDLSGKFLCEPVIGNIIMPSNAEYSSHDGLSAYSPKTCLIVKEEEYHDTWYVMNSKGESVKFLETRANEGVDYHICKKDGHVTYFTIEDYKLCYATVETEE